MSVRQADTRNVPGSDDLHISEAGDDEAATSEAAGFAGKNLDEISKQKDHGRREKFRDHAFKGAIIILWLLIIATGCSIFSLAVHSLTHWKWLSTAQLGDVKTYVFSGAVVAAVGGYLKKYLD